MQILPLALAFWARREAGKGEVAAVRWGAGKGGIKGRDEPEALPPPETCGG